MFVLSEVRRKRTSAKYTINTDLLNNGIRHDEETDKKINQQNEHEEIS